MGCKENCVHEGLDIQKIFSGFAQHVLGKERLDLLVEQGTETLLGDSDLPGEEQKPRCRIKKIQKLVFRNAGTALQVHSQEVKAAEMLSSSLSQESNPEKE